MIEHREAMRGLLPVRAIGEPRVNANAQAGHARLLLCTVEFVLNSFFLEAALFKGVIHFLFRVYLNTNLLGV